jgi:hypothetical protein
MVLNEAVALPRDTFWVMAEPTLCYSLFSNLTLNAIEASPSNGIVSIFLDQGSQARIRVHNLGVVPADVRSKFFEKYVTSGKTQGTGLGTYSARLLATTMGGKIEMQTDEESGTTLTVFLVSAQETALVHQSPSLDRNTEATQLPTSEEEQLPAGDPLRSAYALLVQDLELNSFEALARAKSIHTQLKNGSTEKKIFSQIIESLMRFDFETAKSILRNISSSLEL